jgi:hypothetical protein
MADTMADMHALMR